MVCCGKSPGTVLLVALTLGLNTSQILNTDTVRPGGEEKALGHPVCHHPTAYRQTL